MTKNNIIISQILIFFAVTSFFLGFYLDEVPMGAGGYNGDFTFVLKSIDLFSSNSINNSILLFSETSNRPPLIYILHKLLNPFFTDELNFRRSVFVISLIIPILFFLCLKEKFQNTNKILLILLSSIILLNPYVRNSSYWGLEENYAIIASLVSFLFYLKISKQKKINSEISLIKIFIITLSSSLCVYFDQKFIIVPAICFLKIFFGNYSKESKILSVLFYIFFSIPYVFLILIWGGILPPRDIYHIGSQFYLHHFGFGLTMIAFTIFPFLIFQIEKIKYNFKKLLSNKNFFWLFLVILIYVSILVFFYDNEFLNNKLDGGGIVKKLSFIFFSDLLSKQLFVYSSFILSWIFIFFIIKKNKDLLVILYFLIIAVITKPFYQEYFDPIIFILLFLFFSIYFKINYLKIYIIYFYHLIFLVGTISYYL